jgi:hypothetical protein
MAEYAVQQFTAGRPLAAVARALGLQPVLDLVEGTGAVSCDLCRGTTRVLAGNPMVCASCDREHRGVDRPEDPDR